MIRLTNIKLALNHQEHELEQAILAKLAINKHQLVSFTVFKRGYDARNKTKILLIYTLDVETVLDAKLLEQYKQDIQVKVTPDMSYKFVGQAPSDLKHRPVVIGMGPCGLFVGSSIGSNGLQTDYFRARSRSKAAN